MFERVKAEENVYRELFAKERDSKELDDPHALLLDPHECSDIFKYVTILVQQSNYIKKKKG